MKHALSPPLFLSFAFFPFSFMEFFWYENASILSQQFNQQIKLIDPKAHLFVFY